MVLSRRSLMLAVLVLAASCWVVLTMLGHQHSAVPAGVNPSSVGTQHHSTVPSGPFTSHESSPSTGFIMAAAAWLLMVVAMMLPPALPMLEVIRSLVARRPRPLVLVTAGILSFLGVWALAGLVMVTGDMAVSELSTRNGWVADNPHVIAALTVAFAAVYQVSGLKRRCLTACRSPRLFAMTGWRGERSAATEVSLIATRYGLSCVGCCWALMLIMFAVGTTTLWVMVALAVAMAAERLLPHGQAATWPIAGGAAVLSLLLATGVVSA